MYGDCKRIQDNEGECTMIKMSEMYRISGGCRSDKTCCECMNYVDEKHSYCLVYPKEFNGDWDGSRNQDVLKYALEHGMINVSYSESGRSRLYKNL